MSEDETDMATKLNTASYTVKEELPLYLHLWIYFSVLKDAPFSLISLFRHKELLNLFELCL